MMTFEERELRLIHALRNWYKKHYESGLSDEAFIIWLEDKLADESEEYEIDFEEES